MSAKVNARAECGGKWRTLLRNAVIYSCGSVLFSLSMVLFLDPNHIAPGGITGLSVALHYLTGIAPGTIVFVLNLPVLVISWRKLGFRIIASSLYVVVLSSALINFWTGMRLSMLGEGLFSASLYGGLVQGVGMGLIFLGGATIGGTTLVCKLIRLRFPQFRTGKLILAIDTAIVLLSAVVLADYSLVLYAAITLIVATTIIDLILQSKVIRDILLSSDS